jgi:hypothetical protein
VIVWSRGLGKQRLPLTLADAAIETGATTLTLKGNIEPVCWDYAIRLKPNDLRDFLAVMARPTTVDFLAERPGVLIPFVVGLVKVAPGLIVKLIASQFGALFRKRGKS